MLCSNQARMVVLDRAEEILPTWVLWMQGVYMCLERECMSSWNGNPLRVTNTEIAILAQKACGEFLSYTYPVLKALNHLPFLGPA